MLQTNNSGRSDSAHAMHVKGWTSLHLLPYVRDSEFWKGRYLTPTKSRGPQTIHLFPPSYE
jgi:hypothetical protein